MFCRAHNVIEMWCKLDTFPSLAEKILALTNAAYWRGLLYAPRLAPTPLKCFCFEAFLLFKDHLPSTSTSQSSSPVIPPLFRCPLLVVRPYFRPVGSHHLSPVSSYFDGAMNRRPTHLFRWTKSVPRLPVLYRDNVLQRFPPGE